MIYDLSKKQIYHTNYGYYFYEPLLYDFIYNRYCIMVGRKFIHKITIDNVQYERMSTIDLMFVKVPGIKIVDNVIKNNNKIIFNNETHHIRSF